MPQLRESFTFPLERNVTWRGSFATEPAEAAWANEAIFFVRVLESEGSLDGAVARAQLSPDGMHWCDEGTVFPLPARTGELGFCRLQQFGGWLRLCGELPPDSSLTVIAYLVLKG